MHRIPRFGLLLVLLSSTASLGREVQLGQRRFTIPDDMELAVVAASPLTDRPICVDFDEQGNLYVAESSGSNDNVQQQLIDRPHSILRLRDTNGDGRFDARTVFADRMMFPEGTLWHDGSLYVAAPPSIWKLTDTDGDGVADIREEWFQGKTLTGCANDLHGPYLGRDGWIYWCKGAFAEQTHERPGQKPLITRAAHIFRRRPEGGPVESVMTGGMDNPVEVVFTPGGERIFTTTFLQHPGGGLRDGLIHAIYGGVYGKRHGVLDGHPRTGGLMPVLSHLGAAAPAGLVHLETDGLGAGYRNNLLSACFNLHRIKRHQLRPHQGTFTSQDEDLVVCDHLDFHPTDVIEDVDGSVLIIDTGGWYKLCCPTSQLKKPDVLGAIYRLRRSSAPRSLDPRGSQVDWSSLAPQELTAYLDDPRWAVRRRATQRLVSLGKVAIEPIAETLEKAANANTRRSCVWTLCQINDKAARNAIRAALDDEDAQVRQAAIHSVGVWRDARALVQLTSLLGSKSLANRRAAAEALGRIGSGEAVPALLRAIVTDNGRVLNHSLMYALIEIGDAESTRVALSHDDPLVRYAALLSLGQMNGGSLGAEDVCPLLTSSEPLLRDAALLITSRHPEWGEAAVRALKPRLLAPDVDHAERERLRTQLEQLAVIPHVQELMNTVLRTDQANTATKTMVVRALGNVDLAAEPLTHDLLGLLGSDNVGLVRGVVGILGGKIDRRRYPRWDRSLVEVANSQRFDVFTRLSALQGVSQLDTKLFSFVIGQLPADQPVSHRALAAEVISDAKLSPMQRTALADVLPSIGPLELSKVLEAYQSKPHEPSMGSELLTALERSAALSSLRPEQIESLAAQYGPEAAERAANLLSLTTLTTAQRNERLENYLDTLPSGDIRRGQVVFHDPKAACAACHAMGYLGGTIGPDLTRIARVRTRRDMLEALLFPSASFVRSYEPVTVVTTAGESVSGILHDQTDEHLILQLSATERRQIATSEVEELLPGKVSVMPAGLEQQLTEQQLADLLAFLESRK